MLCVLLNVRKLGGGTANGIANPIALENRNRIEPIDAYMSDPADQVTYASIVPMKPQNIISTNSNSQPPNNVIYAELATTPPPVVNADNSA